MENSGFQVGSSFLWGCELMKMEESSSFLELVVRCFIVWNDHRNWGETIQYILESFNEYAETLMQKSTTIRKRVLRALSKILAQCMTAPRVTWYEKRGALDSERFFYTHVAVSYDSFLKFQLRGGGILGYWILDDRMSRVVTCSSRRY